MKDQYFGDASDFVKYGVLRQLANDDLHLLISWMLTEPDRRSDGRHVAYLSQPARFREYDPELFDALADAVASGQRSVAFAETRMLVPRAGYQRALLTDSLASRRSYLQETLALATDYDIVFFDPDNGLEVPSTPSGQRGSSKYLYWQELAAVHAAGVSVVVYQHFPRIKREGFLDSLCLLVRQRTGAHAFALRAPRVAFVFIPCERHRSLLQARAARVASDWSPLVSMHS